METYGFLGLGIMGSAMAKNLIKAGFKVKVWNRSQAKCEEFAALGAAVAATPAEVTSSCAITIAMLADPAAAREVCFGPQGALEGIGAGRGYVDMSTVDAATAQEISTAVTAKGGRFLEAPVSGSKKPAEDGTLIILAAGDHGLFDKTMPLFEKMGKKSLFLGDVGRGAEMKLIVNMVMGGMMTIFCEGLALAEKAGLASADLLDVLDSGALANPMFKLKGAQMTQGMFDPAFPLKHMQKDMRLAVALGDALNQPLASAAAANESFKRAKGMGLADRDFCAVLKAITS
ncbi:NAD(P)-dependent oxidoreductase [Geomonas paludis]|uniref:3-hydroxyisobutyrate dehydrogenase n=1 Tax=Geomonas paludis TaxID=2740185 RepID=A0A6V8MRH8_9BACT|nr:NAD(P)-dependent oxidoreductase [Geomonas paludis]UPU35713.1 NAD(P)-dependent oxidoreductase [Geomonas paludis]GFO62708.1 3-hydroxyisobutyrate dehydrogenase [Geomonas paludis]